MSPVIPSRALAERFELIETFSGGEGWTGHVRGHTGKNDELVLKILPAGEESGEATLLASLRHPRIPKVLETGRTTEGNTWILREFCPGAPLQSILPLTPTETVDVAVQLLEILGFVHLRGILHLDLKPANVLRDGDFYHLLDFGLGQRGSHRAGGGTPFFASPEVLLGLPADARSDLFSLGAVLFVALRQSDTPLPLSRFLQRFPRADFFDAIGATPDELPAPFDRFLPRLLAVRPGDRFPDAQEALEALTGFRGRPSLASLRPDPVGIYDQHLQQALASLGEDESLRIQGGDPEDRRLLIVHAAASLTDTVQVEHDATGSQLMRGVGSGHQHTVELPTLATDAVARHLESTLGLPGSLAIDLGGQLLADGGVETAADLGELLIALARNGRIQPDGSRFVWPEAWAGRVSLERDTGSVSTEPTELRRHAAAGRAAAAIAAYQTTLRNEPEGDIDRERRLGLAEGLILGGESVRSLSFTADLPLHRARALFELGRSREAEAAMRTWDRGHDGSEREHNLRERLAASLEFSKGEFDAAARRLRATLERQPDPQGWIFLALVLLNQGRAQEAREILDRVLSGLSPIQHPYLRAAALTNVAEAERRLKLADDSRRHNEEALELHRSLGHVHHAATTSMNLGVLAKDRGHFEEALDWHRRARSLFRHTGDNARAALAEANLGIVSLEAQDPATAKRRLSAALAELDELGQKQARLLILALLARAHAELGEWDAAEEQLRAIEATDDARVQAELSKVEALRSTTEPPDVAPTMAPEPSAGSGIPKEVFRTFLNVNRRLAGEANLDRAMQHLLDAATTLTGGRMGMLLVRRDDGVRREFSSGDTADQGPLAFSRSMIHRALQEKRILTGDDARADRELADMPSVRNLQARSVICVPFQSASGAEGALYVEHPGRAAVFGDGERAWMEVLADQAAIAVDRMLREEQMAQELEQSQRELAAVKRTRRQEPTKILGKSKAMASLKKEIERLAPANLAVLIRGETGTGKDLVARAIHEQSTRSHGPFVAENCSAIPAELMESELFGHTKGAFTGADADKPGLLELASGGTLFLDEIGDMPLAMQAKLLRALQEGQVRRVGGGQTTTVDLRVVSATHRDLRTLATEGSFREDLYYRLAAVELLVPPLRDRDDDALVLARAFLGEFAKRQRRTMRLNTAAENRLLAYPWPGNVRELRHVIERAVVLTDTDEIGADSLPEPRAVSTAETETRGWPATTLAEAEKRTIQAALRATGGEKAKAARLLGISRTALYDKLKRMGQ